MATYALLAADVVESLERLRLLEAERALAGLIGLDRNQAYLEDLRGELTAARAASAVAAVTAIASLRAALDAPLEG